jgi:hypothetical protein
MIKKKKTRRLLKIIYSLPLPVLPGSFNFSFMVWAKASWVMAPVPGYCTWHLLYWLQTCGALY